MQKHSSWSASVAKTLFVCSFVTHCVSAVAIAGTGTAVSPRITPPFPAGTGYGSGSVRPFPTATGHGTGIIPPFPIPTGTGNSKSLSSSTKPLLSTGGTIPNSSPNSGSLSSTLPATSGGTSLSTGPIQGTGSSSSSTLSLYSVTFGAPSIAPVTIIQSGTTEMVPVINGGSYSSPITLPPIITTISSSQATASVSSVSSEVAGLIPVIKSWKINPSSLKSDTLGKIGPVKSDVEGLISDLGGGSSSKGCGAKRKRGLLGAIGDIVNGLSCMAEDLGSITDHINANDVDAIDDPLDDLTSENDDLTNDDDDNDNKSNSNSNSDSSTSTSKSSSSLCTSSNTALQVTVQCVPTSFSTSGSIISTTTCSPLSTVTASGCFVTGLTTTVSASTSASITQTPCASDTCGTACPMNDGGPLSGGSWGTIPSTENCALIQTTTVSTLPTAGYGIAGSTAVASPTPESIAGAPSKRSFLGDPILIDRTLADPSLVERALPSVTPGTEANYIQTLSPFVRFIGQTGEASAYWFNYAMNRRTAVGVNGIYGCTSVIISSEKGVYISHIWENPVFIDGNYNPTSDNTFTTKAFNSLRYGTQYAQSITDLIGTNQVPGPLNAIYLPKVFVLTPFTTQWDRDNFAITTTYRYQARAQQLAQQVGQILPGSENFVLGYTRTSSQESTAFMGTAGRAILEFDPFERTYLSASAPNLPPMRFGRWRLWVETQMIVYQDVWLPLMRRRDIGDADPCASLASSSSNTATSSSTSTTSSGTSTPSSTLVTPSATATDSYIQPTSCVYTVTSEIGVTVTDAYTMTPTVATMCWCDSSIGAGINTVTGTSSTSYLVCELSSSITVSTMAPPPPTSTPPPPPPPPPPPSSTPPPPAAPKVSGLGGLKSPDLSAKPCVDCMNDMGASNCGEDNQCYINQCNTDKSCQACPAIDCTSYGNIPR